MKLPSAFIKQWEDSFKLYVDEINERTSKDIYYIIFKIFKIIIPVIVIGSAFQFFQNEFFSFLGAAMLAVGLNALNSNVFLVIFEIYIIKSRQQILEIVKGMNYLEFTSKMESSQKEICFLLTYFHPLIASAGSQNVHRQEVLRALKTNLQKNPDLNIKFLFLNPSSPAAIQRGENLAKSADKAFVARIKKSLFEMIELRYEDNFHKDFAKIEVKVYDFLPPFFYIQCDKDISVIHYPPEDTIQEGERIDTVADNKVGAVFRHIFNDMWTRCDEGQIAAVMRNFHVRVSNAGQSNISSQNQFNKFIPYVKLGASREKIALLFRKNANYSDETYKKFIGLYQIARKGVPTLVYVTWLNSDDDQPIPYFISALPNQEFYEENLRRPAQITFGTVFDHAVILHELLFDSDPRKEYD